MFYVGSIHALDSLAKQVEQGHKERAQSRWSTKKSRDRSKILNMHVSHAIPAQVTVAIIYEHS